MITVHFPAPDFKIREEGGRKYVFDRIRKTWLLLTGEEWVRQNFINYLVKELHYPPAFIALEKALMLHELKKRFDVLVYDKGHQPWMMIECKAAEIQLSDQVLQQLLRYHISIPVPLLVITNGIHTMAWKKEEGRLVVLEQLPLWKEVDG